MTIWPYCTTIMRSGKAASCSCSRPARLAPSKEAVGRALQAAQVDECGEQVLHLRGRIHFIAGAQAARRPAHEARHAVAALVELRFAARACRR